MSDKLLFNKKKEVRIYTLKTGYNKFLTLTKHISSLKILNESFKISWRLLCSDAEDVIHAYFRFC